jgi:5'-3' exoribonuclease 2
MQVYISDASVPGEGEHKIMDFIRRQRVNRGHDPNTKHVIYGLVCHSLFHRFRDRSFFLKDADLIMLALATHEPHFKVLREDVFFQDTSPSACRICGQEGHYAAQCTGTKAEVKKEPPKKKPFIFLDVSILREYLEVELNVPQIPFPFSLEQAVDDWVLLIFFVGNDFLPHLPSLEIREGAIDTLLKIWKDELPRMGGYLTNNGHLELSRAEIILSGLARREDDIFKRRREGALSSHPLSVLTKTLNYRNRHCSFNRRFLHFFLLLAEERQDQNAKRRKLEMEGTSDQTQSNGPSPSLNLTTDPIPPPSFPPLHASLPPRPDFAARADSMGLGGPKTVDAAQNATAATLAFAGSNRDIVANRRAIRMANMSAAEVLKAELGGLQSGSPPTPSSTAVDSPLVKDPILPATSQAAEEDEIPGLGGDTFMEASLETETPAGTAEIKMSSAAESFLSGVKRKFEETEGSDSTPIPDEDEEPGKGPLALKVNPDGTVEQEDTVK